MHWPSWLLVVLEMMAWVEPVLAPHDAKPQGSTIQGLVVASNDREFFVITLLCSNYNRQLEVSVDRTMYL